MKFVLGLFFTSAFLYSVQMLQCLTCDNIFCENPSLTNCFSNESCATAHIAQTSSGFNYTMVQRLCLLNEECAYFNANGTTFTLSFGFGGTSFTSSVSCCNTDGCNKAKVDAPNKNPNGLKCKSCSSIYDQNCDSDLDCVGNQDRCFNGTASLLPSSFGFGNNTLKGCISRDLCQPSKFSNMTCCEGSFCNKGLSYMSEVNISLLLLSLIAVASLL
ncbi:phospholipase A2 inhibitor and Ly6/PLAUR domain-containing protein-like isoform X1 [Triplophysa rosa]|uniref:phospholipase A2 inhibitor and Ly6/PLAUR domain-containing protein-like isoform X1 n=1 Tax=Triplophysa rosa TaxID=992332 RepID=UPI0025460A8C|nr:phospholipase A2 inhibitor and Ly6/PLAUR domain-containing protein-like isoform X1 [Triplophysa rosa]